MIGLYLSATIASWASKTASRRQCADGRAISYRWLLATVSSSSTRSATPTSTTAMRSPLTNPRANQSIMCISGRRRIARCKMPIRAMCTPAVQKRASISTPTTARSWPKTLHPSNGSSTPLMQSSPLRKSPTSPKADSPQSSSSAKPSSPQPRRSRSNTPIGWPESRASRYRRRRSAAVVPWEHGSRLLWRVVRRLKKRHCPRPRSSSNTQSGSRSVAERRSPMASPKIGRHWAHGLASS